VWRPLVRDGHVLCANGRPPHTRQPPRMRGNGPDYAPPYDSDDAAATHARERRPDQRAPCAPRRAPACGARFRRRQRVPGAWRRLGQPTGHPARVSTPGHTHPFPPGGSTNRKSA